MERYGEESPATMGVVDALAISVHAVGRAARQHAGYCRVHSAGVNAVLADRSWGGGYADVNRP